MSKKDLNIREYLKDDSASKTGLRWIKDYRQAEAGDEAYTRIDRDGYYVGGFNSRTRHAHQVIMYLTQGEWSSRKKHIDHRDGNKLNNNIDNLHFVSPTGNQRNDNRKMNSNNTSGIKGLDKWTANGYTYWRARYGSPKKAKINKDKQVCINWLTESRKNDSQYIHSK